MNLEDLYRLLRSSHVQAQGIVDTIDEPLVVLDERGHVMDANRAFFSTFLVERDDTIGVQLNKLGDGQWNVPDLTGLISEVVSKATAVIDYEVTHDFPNIGERTFLLTARRLWKPDNNSTNVLLVFSDVTGTRERERESSLLFSEMRHRLMNLLGVVRALASQTETQNRTADEFKAIFLGRFDAVLNAQSLMSKHGPAIALVDLVMPVVGSLGGNRLHVRGGPEVIVAETQVVPLAMILHELATNAIKYGAFAVESGAVDVSWDITPEPTGNVVRLLWTEKGTAPAPAGAGSGKGTDIIKNSARLGLHGSAELTLGDGGLEAIVMMPLIGDNE